ncbi:MAG TPA: GAF domain-containing protein [Geodermatophilus sp.]|nr:GAF domain-containing protein [Geodermatophilus sp.]
MTSRAVKEILAAVWASSPGAGGLPDGLVRLCARSLPVSGVGLALMTDDGPAGTVAASDGGAQHLEELQFALGEGPCVDASRTGRPVLAPDLASTSSRRWPHFSAGADAAGLQAIFAFPLRVGGIRLGVLDLYRDSAGELTREHLGDALSFADAATQLLLDLQAQDTTQGRPPPHALAVLDDRAEVHQATGVISVHAGVSLAQALALLRARAWAQSRPIGDLARDVLDGVVELAEDDEHD